MNLTRLAIDNNRLTWVLLLLVVASGVQTFLGMPRDYDPGFIIRAAQVVSYFPGASPERVEKLVSSPLEEVIMELPELDFVKSESRTGVSIITVNIKESYTHMRPIWDSLRRKVEEAGRELPDGVSGPFVNDEFGDVYGIVITLTGDGFGFAELSEVADEVRSDLLALPDSAKVDILGEQDERVFVEYDNARLAELGLSPGQLLQALSARNIVISGGEFRLGDERISLEPSGNFESVGDIADTILSLPGGRLLKLSDIAEVSRGYVDPPAALIHSSGPVVGRADPHGGRRALALAISMREGGNNIALGEQVTAALERFNARYPWGIEFQAVNFSPAEVDRKVSDFVVNLLQAVAVVTAVMLISLGLRTGLIVASLVPITMLLAFMVMDLFAIGLDQISLAALIIALGMLVDNGIVMSESILVSMERGRSALDAALESAAELRVPLLTASLTTAAAFLPIFLAESNVGEYTASLFKVVSITLLCSWLVSLTVIPLLCVLFMRVKARDGGKDDQPRGAAYGLYRRVLTALLRRRALTLLTTLLVFALAMQGFGLIPKLFFPPSDRNYFKVELELPMGTAIERTEQVVTGVESFMARELMADRDRETEAKSASDRPTGVRHWVSYVGNGGPRFLLSHNPKPSSPNYALMVVTVGGPGDIPALMAAIDGHVRDHYPDVELTQRRIENGPAVTNPVEVRLIGRDDAALFGAVADLKRQMADMGGLLSISDDWGRRIKKLVIRIDQARALRAGVSSEDIAASLQTGLSGLELTEYREGEDVIPVLLRSRVAEMRDFNKVRSLSVYSQTTGDSVPLKQVADIEVEWNPAKVLRRDGVRVVTVGAQLAPGFNAADRFGQLLPWLDESTRSWGPRVRYELGGESESSGKANQSIADKLPIAAFIILILLVGQFNSIRKALIILITIPMGLIGVVVGLLLGQSFFGFMTLLGVISLAGIVINNAIVLLERIQIELDNGLDHAEAIVSAARQRARPILLTTATTVLGLVPLYLGGGAMWEPMALTIMGGLLLSTLLTLGVVPVLYATLYRVRMG
ncbi:MAG: efflux RND transporter permease subunit [Gammaproteobacteria bacterium]